MQQLLLTEDLIHIRVRWDAEEARRLEDELTEMGYRILKVRMKERA